MNNQPPSSVDSLPRRLCGELACRREAVQQKQLTMRISMQRQNKQTAVKMLTKESLALRDIRDPATSSSPATSAFAARDWECLLDNLLWCELFCPHDKDSREIFC